jgi:hypothetical protein
MWHVWETEGAYGDLVGRPDGKSRSEDVGIDGRIILKWTFKKSDEEVCGLA